jgi:hypothetical protein
VLGFITRECVTTKISSKQVRLCSASHRQKVVDVGYAVIRLPLFSSYQDSQVGKLSQYLGVRNLLEQDSPFSPYYWLSPRILMKV